MAETSQNMRIGLEIHDALEFWENYGEEIVGAAGGGRPVEAQAGRHVTEWSREDLTGLAELAPDNRSTLLRIELESEKPEGELKNILDRLSHALDQIDSLEGASFTIEPDAGTAPDERTSGDQPL